MGIFDSMEQYKTERLVFGRDEATGLKTIIAVHDTTLGPAAGGTRYWNYESEEAALYDVLRLSRGMTLKNAAAGLPLGGGKAVIIGDPKILKTPQQLRAYGKIINALNGTYYTAEDVNISTADIAIVHEETPYLMGLPETSGNPSPYTARGVYRAMKAGAKAVFGDDSLAGKTVAVQGVGSVGYALATHLFEEGAALKVYDINPESVNRAVQELGATPMNADEILSTDCDILAPCALGAVLSTANIPSLRCRMVCGAANNIMVDGAAAALLSDRGILYIPDYIANAGGIISCGSELLPEGRQIDSVNRRIDDIYNTVLKILDIAKRDGITAYDAAEQYALGIIAAAK